MSIFAIKIESTVPTALSRPTPPEGTLEGFKARAFLTIGQYLTIGIAEIEDQSSKITTCNA